jgi:hypothetical protein
MADTLTISTPAQYKCFQRGSDNKADILITGTFTGLTPIGVDATWNGGLWTALSSFSTGSGTFSGTLPAQNAGQGTLTIRDVDSPAVTASKTYVGIGDVYLCAGQSNCAGELDNFQSYSHATLKATMWGFNGTPAWADLVDPTGANTAKGSVWPLLATLIMADQGVPVAFIPTGVGSTTLVYGSAHWAHGGTRYNDAVARYGNAAPAGLKAILWYQGESDALNGATQAAYITALSQMLDDFQTDLGLSAVQLVAALIGSVAGATDAQTDAIRLATVDRWNNDPDILAGPVAYDQAFSDHLHWHTNTEAGRLANRWWRCLKAEFYGGALEPARGPSFVSAARTGTTVTVRFTGGKGALQGQSNVTGWSYTDDGTPVGVSAATANGSDSVDLTLGGTPAGVELVTWCSGDNGETAQLRDSGTLAEAPAETFVDQPVSSVPSGVSGRTWFR